MSKKRNKNCCQECCCEPCCCNNAVSNMNNTGCCGNVFGGLNNCVAPIIFLLIACGSGLLNNNCSYLIILLFLLCGGSYGNLFGGFVLMLTTELFIAIISLCILHIYFPPVSPVPG